MYRKLYDSPIGKLTIDADESCLVRLSFMEKPEQDGYCEKENSIIKQTEKWLDEYFSGSAPDSSELPIKPLGTDFQRSVWKILLKIPYGHMSTYGNIAKEIAAIRGIDKMSARAVGAAIGRNPIAIIIPCHRVIGACGHLTGFAGGMELKKKLLEIEGIKVSDDYKIIA